jgi:transcriptional regulator with XRE-family HTH domain
MGIGDKIKHSREALGMTKAELARALGVTKSSIGQWEEGTTAPNRNRITQVARVLGWGRDLIDPRYIGGVEQSGDQRSVELVPWGAIVGFVVTNGLSPAKGKRKPIKTVKVDNDLPDDAFATVAMDEAMTPFVDGVGAIEVGDILIVSKSRPPVRGCVVVAQLGTDAPILRQYVLRAGGAFDLIATNPDFPTVTVNKNRTGRILAVVMEHRRRLLR